jgi:hypothetical protein
MHIKFLNRGQGSARSALDYTLGKYDSNKKERQSVEVLRGNPEQVTAVADSLEFKHRYRSAVIAWHKEDKPTIEQMQEVLDDFERIAFAGLEPNQYCYYAVMHDNDHIHIITPRVELQSGKSFNIAPPGWQNTYDLIRDKFNEKYNWARPDDPARSRVVNQSIHIHGGLSHTKAKKELNSAVMDMVNKGIITNAKEVEQYLNGIEGVTVKQRRSKKSLSVIVEGIKKPIRLEGLAYGREFSVTELVRELEKEQEQRDRRSQEDRAREVVRIERELEQVAGARADYNRGRYEQKDEKLSREANTVTKEDHPGRESLDQGDQRSERESTRRDQEPIEQHHKNQDKTMDTANNNRDSSRSGVSPGQSIPWQVYNAPNPVDNERRPGTVRDRGKDRKTEKTGDTDRRKVSDSSQRLQSGDGLHIQRQQRSYQDRERALNDRIRKRIEADIENTRKYVQERINQHHNDIREAVRENSERLSEADRGSKQYHRESEPNIKCIRESKREYKDTLRRQSGDSLDRASGGLKEPIEQTRSRVQQFGERVRELGKWVGIFGEKVVRMAKKIVSAISHRKENSKDKSVRSIKLQ